MEKLIITIAPTGNVPTKALTHHVPLTPLEIADDIELCRKKGAAVAHIHARDENGQPTCALATFAEIERLLSERGCDIVRQISTGARGGASGERGRGRLGADRELRRAPHPGRDARAGAVVRRGVRLVAAGGRPHPAARAR